MAGKVTFECDYDPFMEIPDDVEVDEEKLPNSIGNECQILNKSLSSIFSPIFHAGPKYEALAKDYFGDIPKESIAELRAMVRQRSKNTPNTVAAVMPPNTGTKNR